MTTRTGIEHIVIDYIRRYWWTFVIGGILQFYAGCRLVDDHFFTAIGFIFGAGFLLGFEILRGDKSITRTLLTLPVSLSEVSSAWRFLGLILPFVFYFTFFTLGLLWSLEEESNHVIFSSIPTYLFFQIGILGLIFYSLTGVIEFRGSNYWSTMNVKGIFFTFLWCSMLVGSVLCGLVIRTQHPNGDLQVPEVSLTTWLVLFMTTISGFFRADILVAGRYLLLDTEEPVADIDEKESNAKKCWQGFGGLRYFIGSTSALMVIGFLALVSASSIIVISLNFREGFRNGISMSHEILMNLAVPFFGLAVILHILPTLRQLRTLPQRLDSLASLLILWPFFLMVILAGFCVAVNTGIFGVPMNWADCLFSITGGAITLFFAPFALRFGTNFFTTITSLTLTLVGSFFVNIGLRENHWSELETIFKLSFLLLVILILTWSLSYLVLRSPHPWKSGHFSSGFGGSRDSS